jgi:hypothetical protein
VSGLDFDPKIMYYPYMPSIVGKRRGKQTYYYLVESGRVDGRPRIVSQQYLGTAEEVMAKLSGGEAGHSVRSQHKRFGDVAAVWSVLTDLDVVGLVDDVVARYANAGASVGTYLALAVLNRVVDPCSKRAFADWWATTSGPRWVKLDAAALDHRRFWDAMDLLTDADLVAIETQIYGGMIDRYGLDLAGLALDMTNFATYIDSANERAPIAQRGKAKQKRVDLRLVGLALVVTRDGGIPIVSHAYPGDRPDVTQFSAVLDELVTRYRLLVDSVESLTVVYDAGQNSGDNHAAVEASGIGFVGSLPPSDHPGLLDISRDRYSVVDADRFEGLTAYDTTVTALGVTLYLPKSTSVLFTGPLALDASSLLIVVDHCAMMLRHAAATGVPGHHQRVRIAATAARQRPGQRRRDLGVTSPARRAAAPTRRAAGPVRPGRPGMAGRAAAPPPEARLAPCAASGAARHDPALAP